jgi:hypothetical protein
MTRRPPDPNGIVNELLRDLDSRALANMADVQRELEARVHAYNAQPQQELGGLSPLQMMQLLYGDWR